MPKLELFLYIENLLTILCEEDRISLCEVKVLQVVHVLIHPPSFRGLKCLSQSKAKLNGKNHLLMHCCLGQLLMKRLEFLWPASAIRTPVQVLDRSRSHVYRDAPR